MRGRASLRPDPSWWRALRHFAAVSAIVLALSTLAVMSDWGRPVPEPVAGSEARIIAPVFEDAFDAPDGAAPDPARWQLTGKMFGVDIQGGRLRLVAAATRDAPADAEPAALLSLPIRNARLEADVTLPGDTAEWFLTFGLRAPPTLDDAYMLVFQRRDNGVLQWRLQKYVDSENTRLTPNMPLSEGLAYRIRLEILDDHIRAAVRPLASGAIPEGSWDLYAEDDDLDAAGTARPHLTKRAGQGRAQAYVDNFRIYEIATR